MEFRNLEANEIECRVGTIQRDGKGLSLLLYKDARCDMRILDETVGPENWQCEYYEQKGTLFCKVGILVCRDAGTGYHEWVWKDDAGAPSNMEAAKGEASDAFKRACFRWGIGRELYTAPFIWVNGDRCAIGERNGKKYCNDRFEVIDMEVTDKRITALRIGNPRTGMVVYEWKERQ